MAATLLKSSAVRWPGDPAPLEASPTGLAFARRTRPATDFKPSPGLHTSVWLKALARITGTRSSGLKPSFKNQYASAVHQALLAKHGLVGSMRRKGNCWNNAVTERFFLNLKMERVWQRDQPNQAEAKDDIADCTASVYNNVCLHSKLGNFPPNACAHQSANTQPIGACEIT